jgi:hypothetical protein
VTARGMSALWRLQAERMERARQARLDAVVLAEIAESQERAHAQLCGPRSEES